MKFFKSRFFIICVVVALGIALITSMMSIFGFSGFFRSALKTLATPFEWCGTTVANAVNGFVEVFAEYDELKAKNESLKAENEELKNNASNSAILKEENEIIIFETEGIRGNPTVEINAICGIPNHHKEVVV